MIQWGKGPLYGPSRCRSPKVECPFERVLPRVGPTPQRSVGRCDQRILPKVPWTRRGRPTRAGERRFHAWVDVTDQRR